MILYCGHSFCKLCVSNIEKNSNNSFDCPFKCQLGNHVKNKAKPNITILELIKKKKLGSVYYG